ncbi:PREDICTED: insulin-induced gene 1 protein [Galeopterus variegatus]|uniref:Insulin-induced gene protein n=1 Tax=Galeopterus variegatus TaxID=482537 RepID=A0ABM0QAB4_GALVR|nr:PREDICTED: insulin-induced gene 1 protein [Galeopterus variegatus]
MDPAQQDGVSARTACHRDTAIGLLRLVPHLSFLLTGVGGVAFPERKDPWEREDTTEGRDAGRPQFRKDLSSREPREAPGALPPAARAAPDARPSARGPGAAGRGGHASSWHHHLVRRSLVLFSVGVVLALVLNLLQIQRNVTLFPEEVIATIFSSAWWVPPCCGTAAAIVGLLYPCIDSHLGEPHKFKREWASVMRCIAVFVGINHASAKLDFANNVQLSLTLAALSLGLWWTFDRSRSGLGLGITIAFLATLITQFLVYNGVYQYTSPDFLYIRSWLPCIFFSGGVTVGNIGRQLAMGVPEKPHSD